MNTRCLKWKTALHGETKFLQLTTCCFAYGSGSIKWSMIMTLKHVKSSNVTTNFSRLPSLMSLPGRSSTSSNYMIKSHSRETLTIIQLLGEPNVSCFCYVQIVIRKQNGHHVELQSTTMARSFGHFIERKQSKPRISTWKYYDASKGH